MTTIQLSRMDLNGVTLQLPSCDLPRIYNTKAITNVLCLLLERGCNVAHVVSVLFPSLACSRVLEGPRAPKDVSKVSIVHA